MDIIVKNGTNDDGTVSSAKLERLWMKKKHLTFDVQLVNEDEEEGEKITVEAHSLRMVPIRDKRHLQFSCIDEDVPAGIDPDDWVECEYDRLPDGISWQYHEGGEREDYPLGLAGRIESLYDGNSPHYLYTPGNPHHPAGMYPQLHEEKKLAILEMHSFMTQVPTKLYLNYQIGVHGSVIAIT